MLRNTCVINSSFILMLRSDGSDKYTDQLESAFIVWFSIHLNDLLKISLLIIFFVPIL